MEVKLSSLYIKAADFPYYHKDEPRELSVYDSLSFVDNFGHFTEGQVSPLHSIHSFIIRIPNDYLTNASVEKSFLT